MTQIRNVAVIVGSLRQDSVSRKLAKAFAALTPGLKLHIVEIGDLPHFDQDLESDPPAQWVRFRDEIAAADAVLFVTPEFNRSVPGALKNAIDVGSRPYGHSVFSGKPAAVISQSPGALGGFGANHQLRQSLVFLDMPVLQQPEAYISNSGQLFDEAGKLTSEPVSDLLTKLLTAYAALVDVRAPLRAAA